MVADPTNGQLRQQLELLRDAYSVRSPTCPDPHYVNKEELLLRHGRFFQPQPRPKKYRRGRFKECFANSFRLARKQGLRYVEGVAVPPDVGTPVHHAWCIDANDRVIDVTWSEPGRVYFGVVIDHARVGRSWSAENQSVLDDWPHQWPILREPYVEPPSGPAR
jgi:hypothetical protein